MPTSFPSVLLPVPLTRSLSVPVRVIEFLDGSEQRFASGDPLNAFEVTFSNVPAADVADLRNFFLTVKGAFDSTWTFTSVDGVDYPNMGLEVDELPVVTSRPASFSCSVKMRQVAPDGSYASSATAVYPALPNGAYVQRPFTQNDRFCTVRNDVESGARYARYEWGTPKHAWIADYSVLTAAELQGRLDFYLAMRGRWRQFEFHDPVANVDYPKCRFDTDTFAARAIGAGQWAVSLPIAEFK